MCHYGCYGRWSNVYLVSSGRIGHGTASSCQGVLYGGRPKQPGQRPMDLSRHRSFRLPPRCRILLCTIARSYRRRYGSSGRGVGRPHRLRRQALEKAI